MFSKESNLFHSISEDWKRVSSSMSLQPGSPRQRFPGRVQGVTTPPLPFLPPPPNTTTTPTRLGPGPGCKEKLLPTLFLASKIEWKK